MVVCWNTVYNNIFKKKTIAVCGYSRVCVANASRTKFATVARGFWILARPQQSYGSIYPEF